MYWVFGATATQYDRTLESRSRAFDVKGPNSRTGCSRRVVSTHVGMLSVPTTLNIHVFVVNGIYYQVRIGIYYQVVWIPEIDDSFRRDHYQDKKYCLLGTFKESSVGAPTHNCPLDTTLFFLSFASKHLVSV